jgi:hypothetical protein
MVEHGTNAGSSLTPRPMKRLSMTATSRRPPSPTSMVMLSPLSTP